MAITIDATAGGANSNSYATLAQANSYYDSSNFPDVGWNDAGSTDQIKAGALVLATQQIDQLQFIGSKIGSNVEGATDYQMLKWPRRRSRGGDPDYSTLVVGQNTNDESFPYCYDASQTLIIPKRIRDACIIQANYILSTQSGVGEVSNRERMIRDGVASVSVPGLSESYGSSKSTLSHLSPDTIRLLKGLTVSGGKVYRA